MHQQMRRLRPPVLTIVLCLAAAVTARADLPLDRVRSGTSEPRTRSFEFTYRTVVQGLSGGRLARVWLPVPQSTAHQTVERVDQSLPPHHSIANEPKYGNTVLFFETTAPESGNLDFSITYRVGRSEIMGLGSDHSGELSVAQRKLFLAANSRVPLGGKPVGLLQGLVLPDDNPLMLGQLLYNKVDEHMRYDKSQLGYGTGDAVWACDSRFGNCTDFHSLFISMSRSHGVPARFEIGFSLPEQHGAGTIGGYHCWAFFHVDDHGWVPVDISEADKHPEMKSYYFGNLTENRIAFTVGRDLTLVPKQDSEPLNYFIYPHVEVDGEVWPKQNIRNYFTFRDR